MAQIPTTVSGYPSASRVIQGSTMTGATRIAQPTMVSGLSGTQTRMAGATTVVGAPRVGAPIVMHAGAMQARTMTTPTMMAGATTVVGSSAGAPRQARVISGGAAGVVAPVLGNTAVSPTSGLKNVAVNADSGYQAEKAPGAHSEQIVPPGIKDKFNGVVRLFCSHQQTEEALRIRGLWLEGLQIESVKASAPPFNVRLNIAWPPDWKPVDYNIATFGVKLPRVIMDFFETEEMQNISKVERSAIPIPPYALDTFVQKKMVKVLELVAECRKPEAGMDAESLKSVTKLENFAKGFSGIDAKKISGPKEFEDFVHKHVSPGWEDKLHFDHVLGMFGFTKAISDKIRGMTIKVQEKDQEIDVTLEHHALRWLTKAFRGYGPVGCLTDMVNLVYAVLKMEQPKEASEEAVMDAVNRLRDKMKRNDLTDLWIPTHLAHDGESDDALTWLLLQRLHELQKTHMEVLIQMPPEAALDEISQFLKNHGTNVQVFRDKDSSNGKAVSNTWSKFVEKKA